MKWYALMSLVWMLGMWGAFLADAPLEWIVCIGLTGVWLAVLEVIRD